MNLITNTNEQESLLKCKRCGFSFADVSISFNIHICPCGYSSAKIVTPKEGDKVIRIYEGFVHKTGNKLVDAFDLATLDQLIDFNEL